MSKVSKLALSPPLTQKQDNVSVHGLVLKQSHAFSPIKKRQFHKKPNKTGSPCKTCHQTRAVWWRYIREGDSSEDDSVYCNTCWTTRSLSRIRYKK